jgi:hypothetical protein
MRFEKSGDNNLLLIPHTFKENIVIELMLTVAGSVFPMITIILQNIGLNLSVSPVVL